MTDLSILFEDGEALVIDKPGGLPLDRPRAGGACLEDSLHTLRLGFARDPVPVHRLDHDTSGCLLLARNPSALKRFAAAFEARQVEKTYLALRDLKPQVHIEEGLRLQAKKSLDRMLDMASGTVGQGDLGARRG